MLKLEKLKGIIPDHVIAQIPGIKAINGPLRLSHFLSQCAHESAGFTLTKENLNYSSTGLAKIFGKYFDDDECIKFQRNPPAIANRVYRNRMGNGDEESYDGWTYRGRGFIQLTGKASYTDFSALIGEDCIADPDLVSVKYPLASAAFFFDKKKIWTICDRGSRISVIESVTRKVNGGRNGLADRVNWFQMIYPLVK